MSAVFVKDKMAAVKQLDQESYNTLVKAHNKDMEMSLTNLSKKENRDLLEKVYASITKLPANTKNTLVFEDTDSEDETLSSKTSVSSKSKLTVEEMCFMLKIHPDYMRLVKECNHGKEMAISTLAKPKNRELLKTLYSKISDGDHDSDDESTLDDASVASKRELDLEKQLKTLTIENAKLKKQVKTLGSGAASRSKTLEEIQAMNGKAMNEHIDTLKAEYGVDAFKTAVEERMKTTMTKIKNTQVKERVSLIVALQDQLEG